MNPETHNFSEDQINSMHANYLYELATETGFGAPRMWNTGRPRNFQEYLRLKCEAITTRKVESDFNSGLQKIIAANAGGAK